MDIYETIKTRRSVRAYKPEPVPEDILNRILEAARLAPSAHNAQEYKLIIVKDSQKKQQLAKAGLYQKFISQATIIIVGVALNPKLDLDSESPFYAINLAIAFDHITLIAAAEGLGTCWIGAFNQEEVKKVLNLSEQETPLYIMPVGKVKK